MMDEIYEEFPDGIPDGVIGVQRHEAPSLHVIGTRVRRPFLQLSERDAQGIANIISIRVMRELRKSLKFVTGIVNFPDGETAIFVRFIGNIESKLLDILALIFGQILQRFGILRNPIFSKIPSAVH